MLKFNKGKKAELRLSEAATSSDQPHIKRDKSPRISFFPFRSHGHTSTTPHTPLTTDRIGSPLKAVSARKSTERERLPQEYDTTQSPKLSLDETALSHHAAVSGHDLSAFNARAGHPSLDAIPAKSMYIGGPPPATYPKTKAKDKSKRKDKASPSKRAPGPKESKPSKSRGLGMFSGWSSRKQSDKSPTSAVPRALTTSHESLKGTPLCPDGSLSPRTKNSPIFGIEIADAARVTPLEDGLPLPAVVIRCIEYLDDQGLYEVGLYRIPGSTTRVNKLRAVFDKGHDINLEDCETDPHSVAGLLKLYLRELPSAALTDELLPEFNAVANTPLDNDTDQYERDYHIALNLAEIAKRLPDPNYYLFHWLCRHLARLDYYSDINKMNLSNLGLIFCPTLRVKSYIFRAFITQSDVIFPLPRLPIDIGSAHAADSSKPSRLSVMASNSRPGSLVVQDDLGPVGSARTSLVDAEDQLAPRAIQRRSGKTPLSACEPANTPSPRHSIRATPRARGSGGRLSCYDDMDLDHMSHVYNTDEILRYFHALRHSAAFPEAPGQGTADGGGPGPVGSGQQSTEALPAHLAHLEELQQMTGNGQCASINRSKMTRSQRRRGVFITPTDQWAVPQEEFSPTDYQEAAIIPQSTQADVVSSASLTSSAQDSSTPPDSSAEETLDPFTDVPASRPREASEEFVTAPSSIAPSSPPPFGPNTADARDRRLSSIAITHSSSACPARHPLNRSTHQNRRTSHPSAAPAHKMVPLPPRPSLDVDVKHEFGVLVTPDESNSPPPPLAPIAAASGSGHPTHSFEFSSSSSDSDGLFVKDDTVDGETFGHSQASNHRQSHPHLASPDGTDTDQASVSTVSEPDDAVPQSALSGECSDQAHSPPTRKYLVQPFLTAEEEEKDQHVKSFNVNGNDLTPVDQGSNMQSRYLNATYPADGDRYAPFPADSTAPDCSKTPPSGPRRYPKRRSELLGVFTQGRSISPDHLAEEPPQGMPTGHSAVPVRKPSHPGGVGFNALPTPEFSSAGCASPTSDPSSFSHSPRLGVSPPSVPPTAPLPHLPESRVELAHGHGGGPPPIPPKLPPRPHS
ncbi:hypothetical protein H4R34_004075 [Dimargaris verticillata]|uniref:Rho-GAP domain-containing protein n=1 Tax=Dimargaris verticillata TaxID=2761393 RepID=A0A9W8ECK0_9FUNG|nr:hypothetical protein H4R34_004075 [Dimargaris verticillata]